MLILHQQKGTSKIVGGTLSLGFSTVQMLAENPYPHTRPMPPPYQTQQTKVEPQMVFWGTLQAVSGRRGGDR